MTRPATIPSLRDLSLDSIAAIAAELRAKDRTLTRAQSIAKAATTPEGRQASDLYRAPGSERPWTQAVLELAKARHPGPSEKMAGVRVAKPRQDAVAPRRQSRTTS